MSQYIGRCVTSTVAPYNHQKIIHYNSLLGRKRDAFVGVKVTETITVSGDNFQLLDTDLVDEIWSLCAFYILIFHISHPV